MLLKWWQCRKVCVLMKSKKSTRLEIPADSYIGWCCRRVKHKSHVSVTRLKFQSHCSHICLWPVEFTDNTLPLSLIYIYSFTPHHDSINLPSRPIDYACTTVFNSKYCYRNMNHKLVNKPTIRPSWGWDFVLGSLRKNLEDKCLFALKWVTE